MSLLKILWIAHAILTVLALASIYIALVFNGVFFIFAAIASIVYIAVGYLGNKEKDSKPRRIFWTITSYTMVQFVFCLIFVLFEFQYILLLIAPCMTMSALIDFALYPEYAKIFVPLLFTLIPTAFIIIGFYLKKIKNRPGSSKPADSAPTSGE